MQNPRSSVPPCKPSAEIQKLLQKQIEQKQQEQEQAQQQNKRRRTAVLPNRSWVQRNPRLFQITFITSCLLIFFSKPLYDAFIAVPLPPPPGAPVPPNRR